MRSLRGKIHGSLSDLIVEEVDKLSLHPHDNMETQDLLVARITQKVLNSTE